MHATLIVPLGPCAEAKALYDKVQRMIALIPKGFTGRNAFINTLRRLQISVSKTTPDYMDQRYDDLAIVLNRTLPNADMYPWVIEIARLLWLTPHSYTP